MTVLDRNVSECAQTLQTLASLEPKVQAAAELITRCLSQGHRLLACGNGGSAAEASHMVTEFVSRFMTERRPYPAISLVDGGGVLTAIGNDYGFDEVFVRPFNAFASPGDVLVAFSTSGRSPNVVRVLQQAKSKGVDSIALLGRDGGLCQGLATVELLVASGSTPRIQEAHQVLMHTLCQLADEGLSNG